MNYVVQQIENLRTIDISRLVKESEDEGYRFVTRLVNEYEDSSNTFDERGEGLFCVQNNVGEVVAIGGINQSPFSENHEVARLRRFYVLQAYRRQGVGTLLQNAIIEHAKKHFKEITVRTESAKADAFYRACGFSFDDSASETTHILNFDDKE